MTTETEVLALDVNNPQPGIYEAVPDVVYHQIKCASQTRLKDLLVKSARRVRYEMDHPEPPTPAKLLGSAIHDSVLLPDLFHSRYTKAGQCEGIIKSGKNAGNQCKSAGSGRFDGAWYCGTHAPRGALPDQIWPLAEKGWNICIGIRDSAYAHSKASVLLSGEQKELTIIWVDEETGVLVKARIDVWDSEMTLVTDLKSTKCAHPSAFRREVFNYGYHVQVGNYIRGANAVGLPADSFAFIAAEKVPPYDVSTCELGATSVDAGIADLRPLLRRWAEYEDTGYWPGFENVEEIDLQPWALKLIEERASQGEEAMA